MAAQGRKTLMAKPAVMRKMLAFRRRVEAGRYGLQLLELNYDNRCNFRCQHCFSRYLATDAPRLTLDDVARLADQAHALGVWQWHLQGGEPLTWPDLDQVLAAIGPQRFHIMITTNGWLMTPERAAALAALGVDKISVSIDSADPAEHDAFRCRPGSWERARRALFLARDAGMQANLNTVVTHQNVRGQGLDELVRFAEANGFTVLLVAATAAGAWAGRTDMCITGDDARHLEAMRERHPGIYRDLWPLFDVQWGCRTVNGLVYVTENGEVLPCPFIHISLGNVLHEPLADILRRGWRVRAFRDHSPRCLAGEDRDFIARFMVRQEPGAGPRAFAEAFTEGDLYPEAPLGLDDATQQARPRGAQED